ncbi:class I SAM-dependent methyltransferase [Xanthomonas massiliensis]|uniref:class I SAM-dependent methyltransferase n=1 Tax=Xanthomonas massiliensis TaxID=1720302 RepID=UPI000ACEFDCD
MTPFSGTTIVSSYAENAARMVPGLRDLPKMAGALLAERVPTDARILVLGAGGGLELKGLAEMQPGWRFDGVDPSAEMLQLAHRPWDLSHPVRACTKAISTRLPWDRSTARPAF